MFDSSLNVIFFPEDTQVLSPETLKQHCIDSTAIWVMKRRANLPYLAPQRLPVVARGA